MRFNQSILRINHAATLTFRGHYFLHNNVMQGPKSLDNPLAKLYKTCMEQMRKVALIFETSASNDRHMLRGIAKYSKLHGPWLIHCKMHPFYLTGHSIWQKKILPELKKLKPDGIIAHVNLNKAKDLIAFRVPVIMGAVTKNEFKDFPHFADDSTRIGTTAADYFLNLGFKNFAFCGFNNQFWSRTRCESFVKRISHFGFNVNIYKGLSKLSRDFLPEDELSISLWLKSLSKPVAVMACNDVRGQHILDSCKLANLGVPDEVAVLGVDNDDLICDTSTPPLSSVALGLQEGGYRIARLLDKLMSVKKAKWEPIYIVPSHVETRQSTNVLSIDDQEVAKAARFIQTNARLNLSVDEAVKSTMLARRTLEQRFRKVLNKTIHEEIRRICVERTSRMLLETNMTVYQIAAALGSPNCEHLARTFRREKGMSPKEYRRKYGY